MPELRLILEIGGGRDRLLAEADFVTLHLPFTLASKHMIGALEPQPDRNGILELEATLREVKSIILEPVVEAVARALGRAWLPRHPVAQGRSPGSHRTPFAVGRQVVPVLRHLLP